MTAAANSSLAKGTSFLLLITFFGAKEPKLNPLKIFRTRSDITDKVFNARWRIKVPADACQWHRTQEAIVCPLAAASSLLL